VLWRLVPSSSGLKYCVVLLDWRRFLENKSRVARRAAHIITTRATPTPTPILAPSLNPRDLFTAGDVVSVLSDVVLPFVIEANELEVVVEAKELEMVVEEVVAAPLKI